MLGFATLAMMAAWYGSTWIIAPLLVNHWPAFFKFEWALWLLNDVPLYFLGLPAFLLVWHFIPEAPPVERERKKLSFGHYILVFLFCLGAMYALSFVSNIIIMIIDSFKASGGSEDAINTLANNSGVLGNILFGAVVPALGEEFVFRYLFHRKLRGAGDKIYMVVSALCFAMFHANFGQIGYAFVLGLVFAWLYARTKNIWLPVSLHFLCNLFGMVIVPYFADLTIVSVIVFPVLPIVAIVLLFVFFKRISATFHAPTEEGWPYKAPKGNNTHYYIDPVTRRPVAIPTTAAVPYMPAGQLAPYGGYGQYNAPPAVPGYPAYGQQPSYPQTGPIPGYGYTNYPPQGAPGAYGYPGYTAPGTPTAYGIPQYPSYPAPGYGVQQPTYSPYGGSPYGAAPNTYNNTPVVQPLVQPTNAVPPVIQPTDTAPATVASVADTAAAIVEKTAPVEGNSESPSPAIDSPAVSQVQSAAGPAAPADSSSADITASVVEKTSAAEVQPAAANAPSAVPAAYSTPAASVAPAQQAMPYSAQQPYSPYGMAPVPAFAAKAKSAFSVCIANAGMLSYLIVTLFFTLSNLFA